MISNARAYHEAKINIQEKPYNTKPSGSEKPTEDHQADTGHAQKHLNP